MSSEGEASTSRRGEPRVSFDGAVRVRYRLFQEFLEENAANISSGGMFIRTVHPGDVGSELDFEVRLEDGFTLIEGRGEVVWVRREAEGPDNQPGMGIRFVELLGDSRALVEKIVSEWVAAGLEPFDLKSHAHTTEDAPEQRPTVAAPSASEESPIWQLDGGDAKTGDAVPDSGPAVEEPVSAGPSSENLAALDPEELVPRASPVAAPMAGSSVARMGHAAAARSRSSPIRLIAVAVVSALIGAGAVLTVYRLYVQPSIDALESRIEELAGSPGGPWRLPEEEPDSVAAAAAAATSDTASPAAISETGQGSGVVDALRGWAVAWTEQRAEDYLAYYANGFVPPDGLDRPAWEAARRARIERPQWIRVALTLVQVEPTGPATAEVRFVQSYRSERYNDLVRKRLLMVLEDGVWKIAAERVVP